MRADAVVVGDPAGKFGEDVCGGETGASGICSLPDWELQEWTSGRLILCIALVATIATLVGARWVIQMIRAPEFLFAARICSANSHRPGPRKYWRRIVRDFSFITQIADATGVVRRVEMLCPRLAEDVLAAFTTDSGSKWLELIQEHRWRVSAERLRKRGFALCGH